MLGSWQLVSEEARNVFWCGIPGERGEDRFKEVERKRVPWWIASPLFCHSYVRSSLLCCRKAWYPSVGCYWSMSQGWREVYVVVKCVGSEARQSRFTSQFYYLLAVWPWANCFSLSRFQFPHVESGDKNSTCTQGTWGLKEIMHVQRLSGT